jgi:hypothetical protein
MQAVYRVVLLALLSCSVTSESELRSESEFVDARDEDDFTPLMRAAQDGKLDLVKVSRLQVQ